jgi:uncharacterized damage-inducible protein DinB
MPELNTLVSCNCTLLRQGAEALASGQGILYRSDPATGRPPSIGAHFRHVLDHYFAFFHGLEEGRIDYDRRDRDPEIETDLHTARAAAEQVEAALRTLPAATIQAPILINVAVATEAHGETLWEPSTVQRELAFLLSHTVHHYALISLHARCYGVELGEDFGVAPSTLEYRAHPQVVAPRD